MKRYRDRHRSLARRQPKALVAVPGALFLALLVLMGATLYQVDRVHAQSDLSVQIVAGYNLVVDSNSTSPSTYAPAVATVMGRFCNNTGSDMTNVVGYIGDSAGAAGTYPSLDSTTLDPTHPLYNTGAYAFRHIGGRIDTADATRYIGTLPAGECKVQYWHFEYPRCRNEGGAWRDPPCVVPTWGTSVKPDDDLSLSFDIWAAADGGYSDTARWTMTMRNEISAMANKIEPNPNGRWFNTDGDTIQPGGVITSNGILYELGNIRQGFDNDGDYVPDYNAWLQPVGDASYDPSCFRLIRTSGVLTVSRSGGNPEMYIHFDDRNAPDPTYGGPLYFSNLPDDNTGVIGEVYYTFLALDGPCSTSLTPYQEVASGFDNEKFNGDYGTGIPPVGSSEPQVVITKTGNVTVLAGGTINYTVDYKNNGSGDAGLALNSVPLVFSDTIPTDSTFVSAGGTGVTVLYSTDNGATWSATPPGDPSTVTNIQWWFEDPLAGGGSGSVSLDVQAAASPSSSFVENCTDARFGNGAPFAEDCHVTMIQGTGSIGDFVWRDENNDGDQTGETSNGIDGVTVFLYWDKDGGGTLDSDDVLLEQQDTAGGNGAYGFAQLPAGSYLVQVDGSDASLPVGYRPTTPEVLAVALGAGEDYDEADFGFGPALSMDKQLTSGDPAFEDNLVVYTIDVINNRPGDGSGQVQTCSYTDWASSQEVGYSGTSNKAWTNPGNIAGDPDTLYATAPYANAGEFVGANGWNLGTYPGKPTSVEVLIDLQTSGTWGTDEFVVYLIDCGGDACTGDNQGRPGDNDSFIGSSSGRVYPVSSLSNGVLAVDVTGDRAWTWSDFNGSNVVVELLTNKGVGADPGDVLVDAVGFRVSNGLTCNDPHDTMSPLPLTDTYDAGKLDFVSADPPESSVGGGTITWDDVGLLYANETKRITVTFRARDGVAPTTHQNCGNVAGAFFLDGSAVNDASDCVTHAVNAAADIGNTVWNDNGGPTGGGTASNGVQDGDEAGIPNVTVYLCTTTPCTGGDAIATDVTDASGEYGFEGLQDDTYYVAVDTGTLPGSSFTQTGDPDEAGACSTCDSEGTSIISGATDDLTQDFGYLVPNSIYGNVWEDNDNSTTKDSGENGFNNVTVYLCTAATTPCNSGSASQTTQTDANGNYAFSDLSDGDYYVAVDTATLPSGATWSNTVDPEGSPGDDESATIAVAGGNVYGSYDFGYYRTGTYTIGDTLYVDWNGDGDQDPGEEGIVNVTLRLYQDDNGDGAIDADTDPLLATTQTGSDGTYSFGSLPAQSYLVVVDEDDEDLPDNHQQTQDPDEAGVCSACDGRGEATVGPSDDTVDFGYQPQGAGSIGDYVWNDADGDGIQDGGEGGIVNITIALYEDSNDDGAIDSGDALVATTTTDSSGLYSFTGLPAGDYLVDVDTDDDDLPNDGNGKDYVLSTDNDPHDVTLSSGEAYTAADFGFTAGGAIGDLIWQDDNGDGVPDANEPGINGVTVNLYRDANNDGQVDGGDTLVATTTTATDPDSGKRGHYLFIGLDADNNGLPAGNYVVEVDTSTLPGGFASTSQTGDPDENSPPACTTCDSVSGLNGSAPSLPLYGLAAGQWDLSRDFGYQPLVRIGDTLWLDIDDSGTRDAGESGIPYITVVLWDCVNGTCGDGDDVVEASTETDSAGYYSFGNLSDGTYEVRVDTGDADMPPVSNTYDPDATTDSKTIVGVSGSQVTSVGGSCTDDCSLDADFGYQYSGPYSIGGTVFWDSGNDGGIYGGDPPDKPYENITVYLWNSDGLLVGTTTTDANGDYLFSDLPDGETFTVAVNQNSPKLNGLTMTYTPDEVGKCITCNGYTTVTISGADETDQDFGFYANIDFGDLPESYGTELASEGPRHTVGSLYLGSSVDGDGNGQPTTAADGDDSDGGDDDDGVAPQSGSNWAAGGSVALDVSVTGSGGYLVGFFDWNGDGDLVDTDETRVYGDAAGSFVWDVSIPAGATYGSSGYVHARFRLYDGEPVAAQPKGLAADGEVEDHRWPTIPTALTLASFTAIPGTGTILVEWETVSEVDTLGFNLYRSRTPDGEQARLNDLLIPSQMAGSPGIGRYRFADWTVLPGIPYYYWLEEVNVYGGRYLEGPTSAMAGPRLRYYLPIVDRR